MGLSFSLLSPSDFELSVGTKVLLPSHNHPGHYPANAYVLWTFQPADGVDINDTVFHIDFGYLRIDLYDYLKVGYGWNANNTSALLASSRDYYYGYPPDLYIPATNIFVEFDAERPYEDSGFELHLTVLRLTGI